MEKDQVKGRNAKRIKYAIIIAGILIAAMVAAFSIAYLTASPNSLTNVLSVGSVDVDIDEDFDSWNKKEVRLENVQNATAVDGVVRAMMVPVLYDEDGNVVAVEFSTIEAAPVGSVTKLGDIEFVLADDWADSWFYKDGFFYYKSVLAPGGKTSILLKQVRFAESAQAKYSGYDVTVEVLADIIQARNGAAAEAWGISVDLNTGAVSA